MSCRPIWDSINTNKKNKAGLFRPVCRYVFINPFVQVGFSVSYDFSQFYERQSVTICHTPNGKCIDFYADINGGVPRSHQSRRRNIAYFFDRSCFLHIFFSRTERRKAVKKTHFLLLFNSKGLKMRSENSVVAQKRIY